MVNRRIWIRLLEKHTFSQAIKTGWKTGIGGSHRNYFDYFKLSGHVDQCKAKYEYEYEYEYIEKKDRPYQIQSKTVLITSWKSR
jgi:hypothetical protein